MTTHLKDLLFSQRMEISPIISALQLDGMSDDLKTGLWNGFYTIFIEKYTMNNTKFLDKDIARFHRKLWIYFFKRPMDDMPSQVYEYFPIIRKWLFAVEWYKIYDFIEYTVKLSGGYAADAYNQILEKEMSGYRFIEDLLVPITNRAELHSIKEAIEKLTEIKLAGAHEHLHVAIEKFSDRKYPDYRNSIKESISAVESLCKVITGQPKATLGEALKSLKEKITIHPSLESGFDKIYGYTCDEGGIRHAMIDDSSADFDDAKYMLIACSAFVNYLIAKASKTGLLKDI